MQIKHFDIYEINFENIGIREILTEFVRLS